MTQDPYQNSYDDYIVVRHPDGKSDKLPGPAYPGSVLRIGRELDNDIILTDPRASRYHAEIRRNDVGDLEIRDLDSANGVLVGSRRLEPNRWTGMVSGQMLQMAETRLFWEAAVASQPTVGMRPAERSRQATEVSTAAPLPTGQPQPAAAAASAPPPQKRSNLPLMVGVLLLLLLLLLAGGVAAWILMVPSAQPILPVVDTAATGTMTALEQPPAATPTEPQPQPKEEGASLAEQAVDPSPTDTPTPTGPQLAIPILQLINTEVKPILLGALPDPDTGLLVVRVRVQNLGNIPFVLFTDDFSLQTRDGSETFDEAGGDVSEQGLQRLGVINRFNDLNLTPGGSVQESLVFEVAATSYDFQLRFEPEGIEPVFLGLPTIDAGAQIDAALGIEPTPTLTPTVTPTPAAVALAEATLTATTITTASAVTATTVTTTTTVTATTATTIETLPTISATATVEPTPTATRPPLIPAPNVVPATSLVGTIAYPVFNGASYDLYFGEVDGSGSSLFRQQASQPAFSPDGTRLALRSWSNESLGLLTMDVSGANPLLITTFAEDQLPTWSADNQSIIFLTRRTGDRKSQLFRASATTERDDGVFVTEGEYPSIGATGEFIFRGWGNTAFGLRLATAPTLEGGLQTVTNADEDTAPALSPDGSQVAFMSRREGQWDIYIVNTDGSDLQRLTTDAADDGLPTWSPDGEAVAFVSNRGGPWAIWVMTPEGDGKSQVITMNGSPDGFVGDNSFASRGWAEERISWRQ